MSVYYRLAEIQYAVGDTFVQQDGVGGTVVLFPSATVMFSVQGEGMTGDDVKALTLFGTAVWHPRF